MAPRVATFVTGPATRMISPQKFTVYLERVEIGLDEDGDVITTLVIGAIEDGAADQVIARSKKINPKKPAHAPDRR
jgi:hypothetical protein